MSDKIKIACVGDSITFGYGSNQPETDSYPALLQNLLGDKFHVKNFGICCACVLETADFPYKDSAAYPASLRFLPDIVILMLGTNDAKLANFAKSRWHYVKDMAALVGDYENLPSKPRVFLATSPRAWKIPGENIHDYAILPEIVEQCIVPMQKELVSLYDMQLIDINELTQDKKEFFPDSIHPNNEGYEFLAKNIYEAIADFADTLVFN